MRRIIIGADGGATSTKLVAADDSGNILGYSVCGDINYNYTSIEQSRLNLKTGIDLFLEQLGLVDYNHLSIGHSSLSEKATGEELLRFCGDVFDPKKVLMTSDVHAALYGAAPLCPGVMVVSGTGTMCVARDMGNRTLTAGGWGFLLGDEGSSYYVAWQGMLCAIHHFEERGGYTAITEKLLEYFGITDIRALIDWLYSPACDFKHIAGFAKDVIQCARDGDAVADDIVTRTINTLIETSSYLIRAMDITDGVIGIYGGFFKHNPDVVDRFSKEMGYRHPSFKVGFPEFAPEIGAVIYFLLQDGRLTDTVLRNLRETM